jgi:L-amino acid N-acyltransferase YncA
LDADRPQTRSERPALRIATGTDAAAIAAIYAPIVAATTITFEVEPPSADEIGRRLRVAQERFPWLVADDGTVLGYAYTSEHRTRAAYRWSVDVSVYVAERARRNGVATRLYRALFALLAEQGLYNAFAGVTLPNDGSIALHRALGFEPVGVYRNVGHKLGGWRDVAWFGRPLRAAAADGAVAEPLPFAAIRDRVAAIAADS